ncbi:Rap family tetratricopeptide repeat protein [Bacillus cereus group sp. BfR-BA-01383]|uniref:Rap family tetratricopeptide repeat protein n=1 Tax=Bacillus cereus group sp. BfR-BA-01383 TaxID=2920327 RepID=UPI001F5AB78C|nr:Rap family tetratricopeptide repeat protein [Bacillus cereus group sp. BfR-BA-01383]
MNVQLQGNEQVTKLFNDWYLAMLKQDVLQATNLKHEIEEKELNFDEDENLALYHSLLDFRYKVLTDSLSISKSSFDKIDSYGISSNHPLSYYYHLFKAIHATLTTNYDLASKHYENAEKLLVNVSDKLEEAEFNYRFAIFNQHFYKPIEAIQQATKARDIFMTEKGFEIKFALCDNIIGSSCVFLKQYEQAEEKFNTALSILQKFGENDLVLSVRNNLGWLYASQNLSSPAIRHLSEVTTKVPTHFKALFLQAREHSKLGEINIAEELIKKGLKVCTELNNDEYIIHFKILNSLNNNETTDDLEKIILEGITYFDKESLYNYTQEYSEKLAIKLYGENSHIKASEYFHRALQAKEKTFEKGALK